MQRYGMVIGVNPDLKADYIRLHAAVWPGVLAMIHQCNMRNYSIWLADAQNLLFAQYDYIGTDHAADMARMAADPVTQDWWAVCMPCQAPLDSRQPGEWWAAMPQVFHVD